MKILENQELLKQILETPVYFTLSAVDPISVAVDPIDLRQVVTMNRTQPADSITTPSFSRSCSLLPTPISPIISLSCFLCIRTSPSPIPRPRQLSNLPPTTGAVGRKLYSHPSLFICIITAHVRLVCLCVVCWALVLAMF